MHHVVDALRCPGAQVAVGLRRLPAGALIFLCVLFGLFGPAAAQGWQVRSGAGYVQAFVKDMSGKNSLVVACLTDQKKIRVEIEFAKPQSWSWRDGGTASMQVSGTAYPLKAAGTDISIVLHNAPGNGFSPQLLQAIMKSEGPLVIAGPGPELLTPQERTFSLAKSAPILARVEQACRR